MQPEILDKLLAARRKEDAKLARWPQYLRTEIEHVDGTVRPLALRPYQVQAIVNLVLSPSFVLGDDTGLGKCVQIDSLIRTPEGLVSLRKLAEPKPEGTVEPLDQVHVLVDGQTLSATSLYHGGVKPVARIKTRRGYSIECTLPHPLMSRREYGDSWVMAQDLKIGDYLCIDRKSSLDPLSPSPDLDPDLARLLGYIVAEAHSTRPTTVEITQHKSLNPETWLDIATLAERFFPGDVRVNDKIIVIRTRAARERLAALGIPYYLSAKKTVPVPVLKGGREVIRQFLSSFLDSEGSIGKEGVFEASSASETLITQIQSLLLYFGVVSVKSPKVIKGQPDLYWVLRVSGQDLRDFQREIPLISARKIESLQNATQKAVNSNHDVIPLTQGLLNDAKNDLLKKLTVVGGNSDKKGTGIKSYGVSFVNTLKQGATGQRNPTFRFIKDLNTKVDNAHLNSLVQSYYFYDPIVSIEYGEAQVADLTIDDPRHHYVANGFVCHNTLTTISSCAVLWDRRPESQKVVVLTTKSATEQWRDEILRFTKDVSVMVARGTANKRKDVYRQFDQSPGPAILVLGYRTAVQDFDHLQGLEYGVFVMDEASAFKNPGTQVHQTVAHLSARAQVARWGLTATMIKNNLMEGYGILKVVVPNLFGSKNQFMWRYAQVTMQNIRNRMIPIITGYADSQIEDFRQTVEPYYLGRPKHEVAKDLPAVQVVERKVSMTKEQAEKYREALSGLLGVRQEDGSIEEKEVTPLTAVSYCQQISNHPKLIGGEGESGKLNELIDMLTDSELATEKVIVFSRFRKMIDIIGEALKERKIPYVRITGDEDPPTRQKAAKTFQSPTSETNVVLITTAAAEAINLQAAKALIFYDTPWSGGDYVQILGRMIRIGSSHQSVLAIHMVTRRTIDQKIMTVLRKKMDLINQVLGERVKQESDPGSTDSGKELVELFDSLRAEALNLPSIKELTEE